ncbi:ABC transporter ATP-binding protein [Halomonas urumqiensis]|uniref:Iron-hydroxamate transporter ATP-binding subunit n=1 Tax=Halomonas urumqiensis TaxID=1684789 RepID=A0A2N7UR27_9GAMM|nr:ATP-binding cassette domain-containing protein [Halomonas urumqiensis]PMR82872.1 iron-hydroxamate transporter ATP-binding subunit [Halomonas urumqiensis]PTB01810.1 iron-hydroxamate transporter ATP-binding subunit [Halomonas urumqiensis]GHE21906.1 iron-hydroxamate transporter ATP-binding protein [Halomonas urumqiensis]
MIEAIAASFEIHGTPLLHPLNLTFEEGRVHGLIGHNGSGKSTLLKLLARQQPPRHGTVHLDGKPLASWEPRALARRVAYLPQHLPATESLTGRELVAFGRYPWRGLIGRHSRDDRDAIERAMALTHTEHFADRLVDTLSGGERQRVWLAMLLAQGSGFLLLDEPLAALDIAHQVDVMGLVQTLSRELGLGVVIVLHDINLAARYCDHLVALRSGRVIAEGRATELMNEATLARIYGLPMRVLPHPTDQQPMAVVE